MVDSAVRSAVRRLESGHGVVLCVVLGFLVVEHAALQRQLGRLGEAHDRASTASRLQALGESAARHAASALGSTEPGYHALRLRSTLGAIEALHARLREDAGSPELIASLDAEGSAAQQLGAVARRVSKGEVRALSALEEASAVHHRAAERLGALLEEALAAEQAGTRTLDLGFLGGMLLLLACIAQLVTRPALRSSRRLLERLERARRDAEASAEARASFAANVSHELRTPLNGIVGMAGFLRRSQLTPRQRRYTEVITSSAEHLRALVDDILDFSKMQARAMSLERLEVDVTTLVEQIVSEQMPLAVRKGVELYAGVDPVLDGTVWGDPLRIRQCLANLISNAIKFTDEGFVEVSVQRIEGSLVRFEVADTGRGVAVGRADQIFEAFQQEDVSTTREHGGTGLGLAITRKLARLMGGNAGYMPRAGGGSRFFFTARLLPASPEARRPAVDGGGVLFVDLPRRRRRPLEAWLRAWNIRYEVVDSLEELPASVARMDRVALVVSDGRRLPPAKLEARRAEVLGSSPRILCGVAPGEEDATADIASGTEQITWPIGRDRFYGALTGAAPAAAPEEADGLRVLLVEDNPINLEIASALLEGLGCVVAVARNGREAVERFDASEGRFDLVLMDWHMPVMDGLAATRSIRALPHGAEVPIVALTAGTLAEARTAGLAAGMNDALGKPIDEGRLREVLKVAARGQVAA